MSGIRRVIGYVLTIVACLFLGDYFAWHPHMFGQIFGSLGLGLLYVVILVVIAGVSWLLVKNVTAIKALMLAAMWVGVAVVVPLVGVSFSWSILIVPVCALVVALLAWMTLKK